MACGELSIFSSLTIFSSFFGRLLFRSAGKTGEDLTTVSAFLNLSSKFLLFFSYLCSYPQSSQFLVISLLLIRTDPFVVSEFIGKIASIRLMSLKKIVKNLKQVDNQP